MAEYEYNVKGLDQLLKALKATPPVVRIGVLGGGARSDGSSNATVGAAHEFGTHTLPARSFLRVPISENLADRMESAGAFDKDVLADVIASGTIRPWMQKVAILAEGIVAEAFDTGGFGKWPALKAKTLGRKKVQQILVETGQLRNSISSEVK